MNNGAWFFFFGGAVFGGMAVLAGAPVLFARLIARRRKKSEVSLREATIGFIKLGCQCENCERARRAAEGKRN